MKAPNKITKHIHEQINENNKFNIIDHYGLSEYEVLQIVKEWYTNGMYPDILQDENGLDLEEICERLSDLIEN